MQDVAPDLVRELTVGLKRLYGDRYEGLAVCREGVFGDAAEQPDLQLLVLLKGPVNTASEVVAMEDLTWRIGLEHGLVVSVLPVSHEEYESPAKPFVAAAKRSAVLVA